MTQDELSKRNKEGQLRARSMKTPMYGNCLVTAPDGTPLFRCQQHRIDWYMSRKLAEKVSDDPLTIRLNFNPKGNGNAGDEYMLGVKINACVVCGSVENLTRHHVVPYCYKTHFSKDTREHVSYDIFPLCIPCHEQYERHARVLKEQIFIEFGIQEHTLQVDESALAAVKSACAILKHGNRMPKDRMVELKARIATFLRRSDQDISIEDIKAVSKMKVLTKPEDYVVASRKVVDKLTNYDDFARRWRQHFIATMNPKYVPPAWDVNKKIYSKS